MSFTTQLFLFFFFPVSTAGYLLADRLEAAGRFGAVFQKLRLKDLCCIGLSLAFYAWAGVGDMLRLLLYLGAVYLAARWIARSRRRGFGLEIKSGSDPSVTRRVPLALIPLSVSVALLLLLLTACKYTDFLLWVWNKIFSTGLQAASPPALLGLSFLSFSAISYLVDIYREKAPAGSFIDCALYLTFFPKIVSGPIVLWRDFSGQMEKRKLSLPLFADGLNRIMIGFAKKLILADTFGARLAEIPLGNIDQPTAAGSMLLYMLQIYFDFSGYSDIALGLSKLFGFRFPENFDFPYLSTSISEFWRRWHISLGAWFREYVYFPLGGSRAGLKKALRNLGIVFLLTGLWHGAGWNYLLWGMVNGAAVILERLLQPKNFYRKLPRALKWLFTMLLVLCFWQLFRYESLRSAAHLFADVFGMISYPTVPLTWRYYFDPRIVTFAVIGILGSTVPGLPRVRERIKRFVSGKPGFVVQELLLVILFAVSVLFLVNSTYSPFIYFRY